MEKYTKHFNFFSDMQSELLTQQLIIDYIESTFFEKLRKVETILNIDLDEDSLYSDNQKTILFLNETIDNKVTELKNSSLKFIELPIWLEKVDQRSSIGELISGIIDLINEEGYSSDESIINVIKNSISNSHLFVDYPNQITFTDEELFKSLEVAKIINNNEQFHTNANNEEILLNFKTTLRLVDSKSLSNIYRQSFINIFSIFDASIFDILKEYFSSNINELETFFNPNNSKNDMEKFSFNELLKFSDIHSLHYAMIETRFSGKYLSTIVKLVKKFKNEFFDESLDFTKLLESINRRNIHIHNKGIVDSKYIEDVNPYSYKLGDTAFISREYLYSTFNLFSSLESNLNTLVKNKNEVT